MDAGKSVELSTVIQKYRYYYLQSVDGQSEFREVEQNAPITQTVKCGYEIQIQDYWAPKAVLSLLILILKENFMNPNFRRSLKSSLTSICFLLCPRIHLSGGEKLNRI